MRFPTIHYNHDNETNETRITDIEGFTNNNNNKKEMSLREEIAEQFNECMGYWEGIKVPDWDDGHSSIDYANQVLKLIEKRIDLLKLEDRFDDYDMSRASEITIDEIKELLK